MFSDPDQTSASYLVDTLVLPQDLYRSKAPVSRYFRGSMAYLHQSLPTLRAIISDDYARLASGGWLALSGQDWLPAGRLRGVSLRFKVRLINPHLTDLHGAIRVERVVTSPLPHRSGRAAFPHPVPQKSGSLKGCKGVLDKGFHKWDVYINVSRELGPA